MLLTGLNDPGQAIDGKYPHDKAKLDYDKIFREIEVICPTMSSTIEYMRSIVPARCGESRECLEEIINHTENAEAAKKRLFEMSMRMAARDSLYFHKHYHIDMEEAFQTCCEGILNAINKYKANYLLHSFPNYVWFNIILLMNEKYPRTKKRQPKNKNEICPFSIHHDTVNDVLDNIYIGQIVDTLWDVAQGKLKENDKEAILCRLAHFGLIEDCCTPKHISEQNGIDIKALRKKYYTIRVKLSRLAIKNGLLNEIVPSISERNRIFFHYHRRSKSGPAD